MSMFDEFNDDGAEVRPMILAAALAATIGTYFVMKAYFEWSEPRAGLGWVYVQYAVLMGVPLAAGLLAWWQWGVGGLLTVAVASAFGTGLHFIKTNYDSIRQFGDVAADQFTVIVVSAMLTALSIGLLLPLAFAIYQLWPVKRHRADAPGSGIESEPAIVRRKVIDERFGS